VAMVKTHRLPSSQLASPAPQVVASESFH
jgi:hypothetical protein